MKKIFLTLIFLFLIFCPLFAQSLHVTWSDTGTPASYIVEWNSTGLTVYPNKVSTTNTYYDILGAGQGAVYYICVEALDSNGNTFGFTDPVASATIPPAKPINVKISVLQAMINWFKHFFG
jgi:hypothetical protein